MLKLHAFYRENEDRTWDATIEFHPFIQVKGAPCLLSAREMLALFAAEELSLAYNKRCRWQIVKETMEVI